VKTGDVRLWPAALALGFAGLVAIVVAVFVVDLDPSEDLTPGPLGPLEIVFAEGHGPSTVRAITREGGCRRPVRAEVAMQPRVVTVRVLGRSPGGGCTAEIKVRCVDIPLPAPIGRRRIVARPTSDQPSFGSAMRNASCPRLPVVPLASP
jgi:hypothetical protein